MGNEASQSMSAIGRCCASEEIEEVIRKDGTQTLQLEGQDQTPNGDLAAGQKAQNEAPSNEYGFSAKQLAMIIKVQAQFRGILARKMIRAKFTDVTLNSITQSFANASVITGGTQVERRPEPVKKYVLPDGALYSGQVRRDPLGPNELIPDGRGKIKWPNGDKYDGRFVGGVPTGEGVKQIVANGTTIQGTFNQGMAQGQGKMTRENANGELEYSYEGGLLMDRQDGYGIEIYADGTKYEGYFKKGKKGPSGTWHLRDDKVYTGELSNGMMSGNGKLINGQNKTSYEGQWQNGQMHGSGIYIWEDGRRYQGQYENDKKSGLGAYMWTDGRVYYGMWRNGQQHGEGTTVMPNMNMKKSLWEAGKEKAVLELSEAERQEIADFVQSMQTDQQKYLKGRTSSGRRSTNLQMSRTRQLSNAARQSRGAARKSNLN